MDVWGDAKYHAANILWLEIGGPSIKIYSNASINNASKGMEEKIKNIKNVVNRIYISSISYVETNGTL